MQTVQGRTKTKQSSWLFCLVNRALRRAKCVKKNRLAFAKRFLSKWC